MTVRYIGPDRNLLRIFAGQTYKNDGIHLGEMEDSCAPCLLFQIVLACRETSGLSMERESKAVCNPEPELNIPKVLVDPPFNSIQYSCRIWHR